jgi:hypothetical protein
LAKRKSIGQMAKKILAFGANSLMANIGIPIKTAIYYTICQLAMFSLIANRKTISQLPRYWPLWPIVRKFTTSLAN